MENKDDSQKNRVMLKIRRASDLPALAETVNVINKFKSSEDMSVTELANILLKAVRTSEGSSPHGTGTARPQPATS